MEMTGPLSYTVRLTSGSLVRRHVDNLRRRDSTPEQSDFSGEPVLAPADTPEVADVSLEIPAPAPPPAPDVAQSVPAAAGMVETAATTPEKTPTTLEVPVPDTTTPGVPASESTPSLEPVPAAPPPTIRRSTRVRHPPDWFGYLTV